MYALCKAQAERQFAEVKQRLRASEAESSKSGDAGDELSVERAGWGSTMRSAVPGTAEETPIRCAPALTPGSGSEPGRAPVPARRWTPVTLGTGRTV